MRYMLLMYPGPAAETETSPTDIEGGEDLLHAMMAFNERMVEAGILLAGDGLKPTRKGARVNFAGPGDVTVVDGPFAELKEILGGYWLIEVDSLADAIAWVKQAPCPGGEFIEIRELYEPEDFGAAAAQQERELIRKMTNRAVR